jgi:hypothetical protein
MMKIVVLALVSVVCAARFDSLQYVFTLDEGSFQIDAASNCILDENTPYKTIRANSPGTTCTESSTVTCRYNNPIECSTVKSACKGKLLGSKCGTQLPNTAQCCYGMFGLTGPGYLAMEGECPLACLGMPGLLITYVGCKTCLCNNGLNC